RGGGDPRWTNPSCHPARTVHRAWCRHLDYGGMTPRFLFAFAVIVAAMLGGAAPASAALQLCNQTSYILYAAFGAATKAELDARGWSRIAPGDCATPIPQSLTAP